MNHNQFSTKQNLKKNQANHKILLLRASYSMIQTGQLSLLEILIREIKLCQNFINQLGIKPYLVHLSHWINLHQETFLSMVKNQAW